MPKLFWIKSSAGLMPGDEDCREWFGKQKHGATIRGNMVVPRNVKFHRKFFAMLNAAYDNWDKPEIETPIGLLRCTFDKFRKDVTILAGYHEAVVNTKGDFKYIAKSISFGRMKEDEFDRLYNDVLNVILAKFLGNWTGADMDKVVDEMLGFA